MLPPLNSVRAQTGLPPLRHADELFRAPPLTLYLTAEPFEYHRSDWPDSVVMVGLCAWERPADPPDWLASITEPIVLVTTSSEFQDDGRLVSVALQALASEPVHVITTLPAGDLAGYDIPANASRGSSRTAPCSSGRSAR
jgi:UDP:flavonoid glycosyltransferase YjiC (YdhE family)